MLGLNRTVFCLLFAISFSAKSATAAEPVLLSDPAKVVDQDRALVLVHGLLGSPTDSFGSWPKIISMDQTNLPDHGKMSEFAVYAVDYQADFKTRTKFDDVAKGVADDLAASQIFGRHRHVWFVAHSMGGLVLKRTLVLWKLQGKSLLIGRLMGIGLLGTPSAGAPLADLAQKYGADGLATTFGWDGELVKDLNTNGGSYLDSLETDWLEVRNERDNAAQRRFTPTIWCGFETKPELGSWVRALSAQQDIDEIVPKLFTSTVCDDRRGFPVKHTDLIKPKDAADSVHLWLRQLIASSIVKGLNEHRDELATAPPSVDQNGDVVANVAERVEFLNRALEPANFDQATGLPKEPELIEFSDDASGQRAKTLVLRGGPFDGNTKLAMWQAAAANKCLELSYSPNRLKLRLKISEEVTQCSHGANVCRGQACD
jgi:pimeloyl-ACP methyl ester carboxylesterase